MIMAENPQALEGRKSLYCLPSLALQLLEHVRSIASRMLLIISKSGITGPSGNIAKINQNLFDPWYAGYTRAKFRISAQVHPSSSRTDFSDGIRRAMRRQSLFDLEE